MSLDVYLVENRCSECGREDEVFTANITHNLAKMAGDVGVYYHLGRPEEISISFARQLIDPLQKALSKMGVHPELYEEFNPANGWGDFDSLLRFIKDYLSACENHPDALIRVDR